MNPPFTGPPSRHLAVAGLAATAIAATASAGVVGTQAVLTKQLPGQADQSSSFVVSQILPEYYASSSLPSGEWAAYSIDVKNTSVTFTGDFGGSSGFSFAQGLVFRLSFLPSLQVNAFSIGSIGTGISNLDASDLSFSGNQLVINASDIGFSEAGASFTLNFSTSAVPGPAGLVAVAGLAAAPLRRRRG